MKLITSFVVLMLASISVLAEKQIVLSAPTGAVIQDISVLVLEEAYQKLGYSVKVERAPNERALITANSGKTDGDVSRIKGLNKKYKNLIAVPIAINFLEGYVFAKDKALNLENWNSLKTQRVVCVRGIKFVEKNLKKRKIDCTVVGRFKQALKLISMGRMDVTIFPRIVGINAIRQFGINDVGPVGKPLKKIPLFHYLHHKNKALVPKLKVIFHSMQENGRFKAIRDKYLLDHQY